MSPLTRQLRAWQFREWLYSAARGAALWLALVAGALALACAFDFYLDRYIDSVSEEGTSTPFWMRVLLTAGQVLLFLGAAYWLVLRLRGPSLVALASRAEQAIPEFDHRLVTTLQLTRPEAQTKGMSKQLIAAVESEAGDLLKSHRIGRLANPNRLFLALGVWIGVLLFAGLAVAAVGDLAFILLQRQALMDIDIPRKVQVANESKPLWPSGDAVELRFKVTGPMADDATGKVFVFPEGQPREKYEAHFAERVSDDTAIFTASLPPASEPFKFKARFGDGRLRELGEIRFEPRPAVKELAAYVRMPKYVDPDGKRNYEQIAPQGEVTAHQDCTVRISVSASKPLKSATLVLFARDPKGAELVLERPAMTLSEDRQMAEAVIDLAKFPTGYSVEMLDDNDFPNLSPPRRGITISPDRAPEVRLLDELMMSPRDDDLGHLDSYEVRGMPLDREGRVQIAYAAQSPLGISSAYVVYRIYDRRQKDWTSWQFLPLKRVEADESRANVGKFIPEVGAFKQYDAVQSVEFYLLPSADPETVPSGLTAGGRYGFLTASLSKPSADGAKRAKLELGDQVEYYVACYDRKYALEKESDRNRLQQPVNDRLAPGRKPGFSESRIKDVVSQTEVEDWNRRRYESRERLRRLEELQRGVFKPTGGKD
jgi:hypothetical protein